MIWFALGAAASAVVSLVSNAHLGKADASGLILRLEEPADIAKARWSQMSKVDAQRLQFRAAEMVRQCGATSFRVVTPSDGGPMTEVALAETDGGAINCILQQAPGNKMPMTIFRTAAR